MAYTSNVIDKELRLPICLLYVMDAHERIEKIPLVEGGGVLTTFVYFSSLMYFTEASNCFSMTVRTRISKKPIATCVIFPGVGSGPLLPPLDPLMTLRH